MKRILLLLGMVAVMAAMMSSTAQAQQGPPLQAQDNAKPKADLNLPEEKTADALKPGSESLQGQDEIRKQAPGLNPTEDKALKPASELGGPSERALEQRNPNADLNAPSPTSEKPGPTERAPEQANLAPTEGYDNCTFSGGRTNCTKTVVLSDKTETRKTKEENVPCIRPNGRPGTKKVTTTQDYRILTTQTTTDEFAGRSGNQKGSTSSEPVTTETKVGDPKVQETGCGSA